MQAASSGTKVCLLQDGDLQSVCFRLHGHMSKKRHTQGDAKIQCVYGHKLPHPEIFKAEHMLFAAEIFLDAPSGEVQFRDPDDIFL